MFKDKIINEISISLKGKISLLDEEIISLTQEKNEITKSSAGDKFETSRSSMQSEHDKVSVSLIKLKDQLRKVQLIDTKRKYSKIEYGALVRTDLSYYLISVGLGKFIIDDKNIFVISLLSPIGKKLLDKEIGDFITFNSNKEKVINIS